MTQYAQRSKKALKYLWILFIIAVVVPVATFVYNSERVAERLVKSGNDVLALVDASAQLRQSGDKGAYEMLLQGHRSGFGVASILLAQHYALMLREEWDDAQCRLSSEYCDKEQYSWLKVTPDMVVDIFSYCEKTHSSFEREACAAGAETYLELAAACASPSASSDAMNCSKRAALLSTIERRRAELEEAAASGPGWIEYQWNRVMLLLGQYEPPRLRAAIE
jgi:hypothetical protein